MANITNGTVSVNVTGGVGPYQYTLLNAGDNQPVPQNAYSTFQNPANSVTANSFTFGNASDVTGNSGLQAGSYKIKIVDANGCETFSSILVVTADAPNPTATPAPTAIPDPTATPVPDPTATAIPDPTATPVPDPTATAIPDPTATAIPDPTATAIPDPTATAIPDPTATAIPDPTATPVPDPTATEVPDPTATPVPDPTATAIPDPTATAIPDPTATAIPDPTATVVPDPTATPVPDPTATAIPDPTATPVPDPTATAIPDPTATPIPDPTATAIPDPTATPVPDPTATSAPENDIYIMHYGAGGYPYAQDLIGGTLYKADNSVAADYAESFADMVTNSGSYESYQTLASVSDGTSWTHGATASGQGNFYWLAIPTSAGLPDLTVEPHLQIDGAPADVASEKLDFNFGAIQYTLYKLNTVPMSQALPVIYVA